MTLLDADEMTPPAPRAHAWQAEVTLFQQPKLPAGDQHGQNDADAPLELLPPRLAFASKAVAEETLQFPSQRPQRPSRPASAGFCRPSRPTSACSTAAAGSAADAASSIRRRPVSASSSRAAAVSRPRSAVAAVGRNQSASSVVRLIRSVERGDTATPALLFQCLEIAQEVYDSGNTSMNWAIAPILHVAVQQLAKAVDTRQGLETEVSILTEKLKKLEYNLKQEALSIRLAKERAEERVQQCTESSARLRTEASTLEGEVESMKEDITKLQWRRKHGLAEEEASQAEQREELQKRLELLNLQIQSLQQQGDVSEQLANLRATVAAKRERLESLTPDAEKQTELATKLRQRDMECDELRQQLATLQEKAKPKKKKPKSKKASIGKRPASASRSVAAGR
mmetsp:Transcript_47857/g.113718  ORF Transcript_47857/g.113718 Transcript_47857/m.113718 type:complete len:398 (+) Transcript_47857:110-1303(+)